MTSVAEASQRAGGVLIVPTVVIVETTTGNGPRDAQVNRVLKKAVKDTFDEGLARRAAILRYRAGRGRGGTVDAIVVATAEASPGRTVITSDPDDLRELATYADKVNVIDFRDLPLR
jgi:hypothetical protein